MTTEAHAPEVNVDALVSRYPNVDPFLIKKWERIFTLFFDRNESHEIDQGDFYILLRKVRDVYGAESEQTAFARQSMEALWEGLQKIADADHDEVVTIDEWIGLLQKVDHNDRKEKKWFDRFLHYLFRLFDVSADGVLDLAEYTDGMGVHGFGYAQCHKAFEKFAKDKNGNAVAHIDPEQWEHCFYDFFFSTDHQALGNHLFPDCECE